jgi:acyl-CoA reductase-like NAD-dependent aldehyde dehydrogenase
LRAVAAARQAFDQGPWPRMSHAERAEHLRAIGAALQARAEDLGQMWPRESGVLHSIAQYAGPGAAGTFGYYAGLADTFPFEEPAAPTSGGEFGLIVREPVGVVGAIVPWNAPLSLICYKVAPALLAGCTVVLKSSPEAPGEGYIVAECAEAAGHLYRVDRGRTPDRVPVRGADRALHAGTRRQVSRGDSRRYGPRGSGARLSAPSASCPARSARR